MIGKQQLTIGFPDFVKGASSSDQAADGGFSPLSVAVNLNIKQGIVYGIPPATDISANLAGAIIASCPNAGNGVSPINRLFVDASANFYSLVGTTLTKVRTGVAVYTATLTDMVSFGSNYYISSATDITLWDGSATAGLTHFDETWWSVTVVGGSLLSFPHPMIVFQGKLWIANGQYLRWYDGTGISVGNQIDLGDGQVIYALGIDPGSGMMLISSSQGQDGSLSLSQLKFVSLYDGAATRVSKNIPVNDAVLSFLNIGDTVFCGTSKNISIWNGSGTQPVRHFLNTSYTGASLPYKLRMTNIGNILYYADGGTIYAFGEVQAAMNIFLRAQKVAYPVFVSITNAPISGNVQFITDVGGGSLAVYYQTGASANELALIDMTTAGLSGSLRSNRIEFPRPVAINSIRVFTTGVTTTTGTGQCLIYNDQEETSFVPLVNSFKVASGTKYTFDFLFGGYKTQMAQFQVVIPQTAGFKRMVIYYDFVE